MMNYFFSEPLINQPLTIALLIGGLVYLTFTVIRMYLSFKRNQYLAEVYGKLVEKYNLLILSKGRYHSETREIRQQIVKFDPFFDEESINNFKGNSRNESNSKI